MTNESELSRRLAATADAIDAEPDLDDVINRSSRKQGRSRLLAVVSAAAVGVVGIGALVAVANREPRAATDRTPVVETAPPSSDAGAASETDIASTVVDVPATAPTPPTTLASPAESALPRDLADPYLDETTVVFDEVMNDDLHFVVRLSDVSYGELFDIEWTAPTGSAEECLAGPAMITGDPTGEREGLNDASAWDAYPLPPLSDEYPTDVATAAGPFSFRIDQDADTSVFVVRTQLPVTEVLVQGEGFTTTSAEFVDGVAAIAVTAEMVRDEQGSFSVPFDQATVTLQPEPSADIDPSLLTLALLDGQSDPVPANCVPTPQPDTELPPPGEQPADPIGAEANIRERFALAVDPTIPFGDKPDDLFDSALGIEQAIDEALNGPNAGYIRDARYEIVDLVFTSPTEAWFEYDLEALGVMFRSFGRATLAGEAWQISRNTICQDLAQAGAICEPSAAAETPPADPTIAPPVTLTESERYAYSEPLFCNPIRPCQDP